MSLGLLEARPRSVRRSPVLTEFTLGGSFVGSALTDTTGRAELQGVSLSGFEIGQYPDAVSAALVSVTGFFTAEPNVVDLTVTPAASNTSLVSSGSTLAFGQAVTLTALVSSAVGAPSGTVDFLDGTQVLATVALEPFADVSRADLTTSALTVGLHDLSARYSGSAVVAASNSGMLSHEVAAAGTVTTLISSLNRSKVGQTITLTARVGATAPGGGVPTGQVDFIRDGVVVASGALANGAAAFVTKPTKAGGFTLTARYLGSVNHATSTSAPLVQTVKKK